MAKMILLVIDSFGIGAMDDCHEYVPADCDANTYKNIREAKKDKLQIPILNELGLGALIDGNTSPKNAYGFSRLAHHGADTFLGHQEIAGSCPKKSKKRLMKEIHFQLKMAIEKNGYNVTYPFEKNPILLINNAAVVGDNLESSLGNIINVTADLKKMSFTEVKRLGKVVREHVDTTRVIALGGPYTTIDQILFCVKEKEQGQWGVDTPKANVYGEGYEVFHMGYGVEVDKQFPMIAAKHGLKVYRLGKTADVLQGKGPEDPIVNTTDLLRKVTEVYNQEKENAAFFVNIQETDLAGHAENVDWYCDLLNETDKWLKEFIPRMNESDILIVMADHGNDPTIGHSNHTREYIPILIAGNKVKTTNIGMRDTMADVGATFCDFFDLPKTAEGESFLPMVVDR